LSLGQQNDKLKRIGHLVVALASAESRAAQRQAKQAVAKSDLSGMESVPPRGSGWVRSQKIVHARSLRDRNSGSAPTRYREVVLTPFHGSDFARASKAYRTL